jgi:hypothetical protein
MRRTILVAALVSLATLTLANSALADVKISDQAYVRHDGGSDATIAMCSIDNRQQNEPAATASPVTAGRLTAGANDYCTVPTTTDAWAGFYYSANNGASWVNSLLPGYPTDTSAEGQASPLHGLVTAAGDPVQEWDRQGHVYYAGIAFNRVQPANASIWLARYNWSAMFATPDYEFTTLVSRGAASPLFVGNFEDKVQLGVDTGVNSPHQGNVYLCWARFNFNPNANQIFFARSTDGGRTFSIRRLNRAVVGSQFCDIAVTRSGAVYVAWRQFQNDGQGAQAQDNAVVYVKSTNGGRSFTEPAIAARFTAWDLEDQFTFPVAAGQARFAACIGADYTPGGCASPDPRVATRDCGDGPLVCDSGYVFHRQASQVRVTADPTPSGNPNAAYVVYDATVPGTETPTGTTFGTVGSGTGSQGAVYFVKTENGGTTWSPPTRVDPIADGHQFFADIDADAGKLHVVWQDSRLDCSAGPPSTESGGDFRTVPFANRWVATNPPGGVSCAGTAPANPDGAGLITRYAASANAGASWTAQTVSTAVTMPQHEQFGNRDVPFFGDYNYVAAALGSVIVDWTDHRDVLEGVDPRYPADGMDGFDVFQTRECETNPDGSISCGPDTTPNAGGLDQNIYGFVTSG